MPKEIEYAVVGLVTDILGASTASTPDWLVRPGRAECGDRWPLVRSIYSELTGLELPDEMRKVERRTVDAVLVVPGSPPRIIEVDEKQHFNAYRAKTLRRYKDDIPLAFDADFWIARSDAKAKLEGGGFGRPKPPLFPDEGGRHRQRAFRDALTDILAPHHGFAPTLRIASFEVKDWINLLDRTERMRRLLSARLQPLT
jgi:hypothetical protein